MSSITDAIKAAAARQGLDSVRAGDIVDITMHPTKPNTAVNVTIRREKGTTMKARLIDGLYEGREFTSPTPLNDWIDVEYMDGETVRYYRLKTDDPDGAAVYSVREKHVQRRAA